MTEEEWLTCTNLSRLLYAADLKEWTSDRQLRLFGLACCRHVWHLIPTEGHRQVIAAAEDYADQWPATAGLEAIRATLDQAEARAPRTPFAGQMARLAVRATLDEEVRVAFVEARDKAAEAVAYSDPTGSINGASLRAAENVFCPVFRDVFCYPGRCLSVSPDALRWEGGAVPKLAQGIYLDRAFEEMPVLADALEEAGCTDTFLLDHCRGPGAHVRGCWILDFLRDEFRPKPPPYVIDPAAMKAFEALFGPLIAEEGKD